MNDVTERIEKLLLKKDARAAGIAVPITSSISLQAALRGGFDTELEDAARASRRAALVLVSGSVERRGKVQVWAEKVKKPYIPPYRDYAETGMGPSQSGKHGKSANKRYQQTNVNHA